MSERFSQSNTIQLQMEGLVADLKMAQATCVQFQGENLELRAVLFTVFFDSQPGWRRMIWNLLHGKRLEEQTKLIAEFRAWRAKEAKP